MGYESSDKKFDNYSAPIKKDKDKSEDFKQSCGEHDLDKLYTTLFCGAHSNNNWNKLLGNASYEQTPKNSNDEIKELTSKNNNTTVKNSDCETTVGENTYINNSPMSHKSSKVVEQNTYHAHEVDYDKERFKGRMHAEANGTINKIDSQTTELLTSLLEKTKEQSKNLTNESIELALELTDAIGSKLLDDYKENSLLNKWKKYKQEQDTTKDAELKEKKVIEQNTTTALETNIKYEESENLSPWANSVKFEIDKIVKVHPYGFAGEREAKRGLKIFEELLEASSAGPIKNNPLLDLIKTCKSLIAVYGDRLSPNEEEIKDAETSISDRITLMNTLDFTKQFEFAVNTAIKNICYSNPICGGERKTLSQVDKEIVSLLRCCLRK